MRQMPTVDRRVFYSHYVGDQAGPREEIGHLDRSGLQLAADALRRTLRDAGRAAELVVAWKACKAEFLCAEAVEKTEYEAVVMGPHTLVLLRSGRDTTFGSAVRSPRDPASPTVGLSVAMFRAWRALAERWMLRDPALLVRLPPGALATLDTGGIPREAAPGGICLDECVTGCAVEARRTGRWTSLAGTGSGWGP